MQESALTREIVRLTAIAAAVSYSGLAQDPDPTNLMLDLRRASAHSKVAEDRRAGALIEGGCSGPYLILKISLESRQFDSSTEILLQVDGQARRARLYDAENGNNKAREIFFVAGSAKEGKADIGRMGSGGTGPAARQKNVDALEKAVMKIDMAGRAAGTLAELYQATSIQLQLPLSTGPSWIEIRLQDNPLFHQFKTACRSQNMFAMTPASSERRTAPAGGLSESKQFRGTVAAFLDALPGFVQRAAQQTGVDPQPYASDTATMKEIIRTCAEITPDMINSVKDRFHLVRLMDLPAKYKPCAAGQNAKASFSSAAIRPVNSRMERSIEMYIRNLEGRPAPFTVSVGFTDLPSDPPLDPATAAFNSPKYIVMGTIR